MADIDMKLVLLALRARALSCVVCTTGFTTLASVSNGYVRLAGSFLAEGFELGMEVQPVGFGVNAPRIITHVTALSLTVDGSLPLEDSAPNRALSVSLPAVQQWDDREPELAGVRLPDPPVNRPYIREQFIPATASLLTTTKNGLRQERGNYKLTWYGLARFGGYAVHRCVDALKACYQPRSQTPLVDGHVLTIRGDVAPQRGQVLAHTAGWNRCVLDVPWLTHTRNP